MVQCRFPILAALLLSGAFSCATESPGRRVDPLEGAKASESPPPAEHRFTELEVQALVMGMADEYGAALGEAMYLLVRNDDIGPKGRWLAQSFLRNGMGASIDIAAGSNPSVALLDLMVLASLQTWAFEKHWIPVGIGEAHGADALVRLRAAEAELWRKAGRILTPEQVETLRGLIAEWIEANPDRTVVALVRFSDFDNLRRLPAKAREEASGLLGNVENLGSAVEDVTLLGERVLWFASRWPYVLGQQVELTAYRVADQPEAVSILDALESVERLAGSVSARLDGLEEDLAGQQDRFFRHVREERTAALAELGERVASERERTVREVFDRLAAERTALLDDLERRQESLLPIVAELHGLLEASDRLARNLTGTLGALDHVVARFDLDPGEVREPLDIDDVTEAATAASDAAARLTALIGRSLETIDSPRLARRTEIVEGALGRMVDRAFWRGFALIAILLAGLALIRLVPSRRA